MEGILEENTTKPKDKWLSVLLTFILPGSGHIYAGRITAGISYFILYHLLSNLPLIAIAVFFGSNDINLIWLMLTLSGAALIAAFFLMLFLIVTAYRSVNAYNALHTNTGEAAARPRQPYLAVFLTYLFPGAGQFYNKEILKGTVILFTFFLLILIAERLYMLTVLLFPFYYFAMKDSFDMSCKAIGSKRLFLISDGAFARWVILIVLFLQTLPIEGYIGDRYFETQSVSSAYISPTILSGDYIVIKKDVSSLKKGDLIAYSDPKSEDENLIGRVLALGGETISPDNQKPINIPQDSLYVTVDNRTDGSDDNLLGIIKRDRIIGRPFKIYWSWDEKKPSIRLDRIGRLIN